MTPARLTAAEYRAVRRFIAQRQIHRDPFHLPVDLFRLAVRCGWQVEFVPQHDALWCVAGRQGETKIISLNDRISPGAQRVCVGHVLGHELLGHSIAVDVVLSKRHNHRYPDWIPLAFDVQASAVAAMLVIPDAVLSPDSEPSDVAAVCHCTTDIARRRIEGTLIEGRPSLTRVADTDTLVAAPNGLRLLRGGREPREEVGT